MRLSTTDLPSRGLFTGNILIDINPFTYKDIIEYNREPGETYIQKILRDMKWLEKDIGEANFDQLSFYDLDCLIFIKKSISIVDSSMSTMNLTYHCSHCGKESLIMVNYKELEYVDPDEEIVNISKISLNNIFYKFSMPNMKKVKSILSNFSAYREDINSKILLPILCMDFENNPNGIKNAVEKATLSDIVLLEDLNTKIDGSLKRLEISCSHCGLEDSVRITELMTDFFRLLKLNQRIDKSKITVS